MLTQTDLYKRWLMLRNNIDIDYGFEEFEADYGDEIYHMRKEEPIERDSME